MKAKVVESERRKFLAGMVAAGSAAAVVALAPGEESAAQSAEVQSPAPEPASRGYQRTAHVDAYYRSLRD
jgi:secreted PhoX family phosphatase